MKSEQAVFPNPCLEEEEEEEEEDYEILGMILLQAFIYIFTTY
jgi:hypothetical protein